MAKKRDEMFEFTKDAGLNPIMPNGGYFMLLDLTNLGTICLFCTKGRFISQVNKSLYTFQAYTTK